MPQLQPAHLVLTLLVAFVAGCDVTDGDNLFGEFRADVTVDGQAQEDRYSDDEDSDRLRGEAVYTIVETEHGREFVLGLFVGDLFDSQYDEYQFISFRRKGGIPGVGAYVIEQDPQRSGVAATYANVGNADESAACDVAVDDDCPEGPLLYGTDGTLAITEVDPIGVVSGRFRFDARGVRIENTDRFVEGTADGEFEARYERPELLLGRGLNL